MTKPVIRTALVTSLIVALAVSALGLWAGPRLVNSRSPMDDMTTGSNPTNAEGEQGTADTQRPYRTISHPVVRRVVHTQYVSTEPVRHHRSTRNSALIVAGSAGTGAAIGALAGGGKGAGIGALAGGLGGLVYDRLTANR